MGASRPGGRAARGWRSAAAAAGPERLYGFHPVREALLARRRRLHRLWLAERESSEQTELRRLAAEAGVPVQESPAEGLSRLLPLGVRAQGVVLEADPIPLVSLAELGAGASDLLVALDGVEDPQNLGAIVRVAEAAGAGGLVLTDRRSAPLSPAVARASAGAIEHLPTARVPNLGRALQELRKGDFWSVGADSERGEELFAAPDRLFDSRLVVVLGAEGKGVRPGIAAHLDHWVRIPMMGRVSSLNVAAAAAVVLYEVRRRRRFSS